MVDTLLEAGSVQISWAYETRATGYHASRPEKLRSVVLKLLKVIGFITKSPNEQYFAYQHLHKKYLPTYRMMLMTLRVTWSHRVQYYH